jgi:hypothetical protein
VRDDVPWSRGLKSNASRASRAALARLLRASSLERADGTAWMAFYCQSTLEIALFVAETDAVYEEIAFKFVQHFMWIACAMYRRETE